MLDNFFYKYPFLIPDKNTVFISTYNNLRTDIFAYENAKLELFSKLYSSYINDNPDILKDISNIYYTRINNDNISIVNILDNISMFSYKTNIKMVLPEIIIALINYPIINNKVNPFECGIDKDIQLLPIVVSDNDIKQSGHIKYDYVVAWTNNSVSIDRNVTNKEDVKSEYLFGYNTISNKEYEALTYNYIDLQNRLSYSRNMLASCTGFTCIVWAVTINKIQNDINELQSSLYNTPKTIQEPVNKEYKYNKNEVAVNKYANIDIYIYDTKRKLLYKNTRVINNTKSFRIAYNVHDKDTNAYYIKNNTQSETDIETYEKSDLLISLKTSILDTIDKGSREECNSILDFKNKIKTSIINLNNNIITTNSNRPNNNDIEKDIRYDSVVIISSPEGKRLGTGFYVNNDKILTNYHVIEGSKLIEIKKYDGTDTLGKVIKTDIGLDLALIKVQKEGQPASFFEGNINQGTTVEAIGHPSGLSFSITRGIVSAIRKLKLASGGNDVLVIQTDTPINPGNSGGPLYIGNDVIGVNDQKLVRIGVEGLGFAIHYIEVIKFLMD